MSSTKKFMCNHKVNTTILCTYCKIEYCIVCYKTRNVSHLFETCNDCLGKYCVNNGYCVPCKLSKSVNRGWKVNKNFSSKKQKMSYNYIIKN